jgi:hypothetical protein
MDVWMDQRRGGITNNATVCIHTLRTSVLHCASECSLTATTKPPQVKLTEVSGCRHSEPERTK